MVGMAFGHIEFKLSELDLRMVKSIPPGGNWKDIPLDVPSKRLEQIRASGGRTTLYGRLRWDAPSYTVTTYFNRPGNGCYIHPELDRVLTGLEAARLQSFPDSYQFHGSKTSLTKQIGNAVPPLLAFAIGRRIRSKHPQLINCVDLFAGAGGLSLGLKWAGFAAVVANDFFKDAAATFIANNPDTVFVQGDITDARIQAELASAISDSGEIDLVVGGPPCQGFSHAGLRMIDDPRNMLYKEFVRVVEAHRPAVFLMENVDGILTLNGGRTFKEIKETFENLGYQVEGRKLLASDFGVPQRRRRVIIIGSLLGKPSDLFPEPTSSAKPHTVADAISNLPQETVKNLEEGITIPPGKTRFQQFLQGEITPNDLITGHQIMEGH
jgi:DNA (cytosine-5)-methyltransferase 1